MTIPENNVANPYAQAQSPVLWSAKDIKLPWKTAMIVGMATAALCILGLAIQRIYHLYWSDKKITSPVEWDKIIRLEKPYYDDLTTTKIMRALLKETDTQECSYDLILIKRSTTTSSDPIFGSDGVFSDFHNPDHIPGNKILLLYCPVDRERSDMLFSNITSIRGSSLRDLHENPNVPNDFHIKVLSHKDWHNGWFSSLGLSTRAIECLTTTKHNLNINRR